MPLTFLNSKIYSCDNYEKKFLQIHHQLIKILRAKIELNSADKKQHKDRKFQTISSNFLVMNGKNLNVENRT